jgi:hypothetical protein
LTLPSVIDITQPPYNVNPSTDPDCWRKFQDACDACLSELPRQPHCIYVPGNSLPYYVSRPILADAEYLSFRGDGEYLSVIQAKELSDVLQFGVTRESRSLPGAPAKQLDSSFWVDATPYLDSTVGRRHGLRTNGQAYVYFHGTPFDMGPPEQANWSHTQQLTLDFAIQIEGGWIGSGDGVRLFGVGDWDHENPSPFYCGFQAYDNSSSTLSFYFATSDGVARRARFFVPSPSPLLQRISIQLDLTRSVVLAFVNGTQVSVNLDTYIGAGWQAVASLPPNLSLQANEFRQFQLGTCLVDAPFNTGNITDQTIFGFKLTWASLYLNGGPGTLQAHRLGLNLSDSQRFFVQEPSYPSGSPAPAPFTAFLPLQDPRDPSEDPSNVYRYVPWVCGSADASYGVGSALFLHDTSLTDNDTRKGNIVRDLTLKASPSYGRALCHGPVYDFKAQDCIFTGGAHNFGALNGAVGYPLKVRDCQFEYGGDAAIYAQGCGMWYGERLTIKFWGREAIRSLRSFLDLRQVFYAPGGPGDCLLKFHDSGGGILDNHVIDFEGGGPALAHIYCKAGISSGPTRLTLRNVVFGTNAPRRYNVVLDGPAFPGAGYAPATLTLDNTQASVLRLPRSPWWRPGLWSVRQY